MLLNIHMEYTEDSDACFNTGLSWLLWCKDYGMDRVSRPGIYQHMHTIFRNMEEQGLGPATSKYEHKLEIRLNRCQKQLKVQNCIIPVCLPFILEFLFTSGDSGPAPRHQTVSRPA
jgi:hypothetical protein